MVRNENVVICLNKANECCNDIWDIWRYTDKGKRLILCGYKEKFKLTGYLVFRDTKYLRMEKWLRHAVFAIEEMPNNQFEGLAGEVKNEPREYIIKINSEGREHLIICGDVKFYNIEAETLGQ